MKTFTRSVIQMMVFVLAFLLLVQLGLWQLKRAEQKVLILQAFSHQQRLDVQHDLNHVQAFSRVKLQGQAQLPLMLLDNQFDEHQLGYHVLTVLQSIKGQYVLADLGFIKGGVNRQALPHIKLPSRESWQGYAYFPAKKPMALGQWLEHVDDDQLVIESLDLAAIEAYFHIKIAPWVLRVNVDPIYQANWRLVTVEPSRHRAYALQWFSMAAILCLIFLWRIFKQ